MCSIGHELAWTVADIFYLKFFNSRIYEFENLVFGAVIKQPYPYFVSKFTGKIGSYIEGLGREFREFVNIICYRYIHQIVRVPTIAIIMFTVNVWTGLAFVATILLMLITGKFTIRKSMDTEKIATDVSSDLNGYTIDVIANFVNVKAFRKEFAEIKMIVDKRAETIKVNNTAFWWAIVFWASLGFIVRVLAWPAIILLNVYLFMHHQIDLAQMTTFLAAIVLFSDFIWDAVGDVSQFNLKLARVEESYRYLFNDRNIVKEHFLPSEKEAEKPLVTFNSELTLNKINFAYPDKPDHFVLKNLNVSIKKGEKIGIVGSSGGGKTTLVKLLLGYYPLSTKNVLIDGAPVDNRSLVHAISYVPQDTSLFHRSIAQNIAYGADNPIDKVAITIAAKRAYAHEFIVASSQGYDTLVGERGIKLSMGQRQRIAIARAFLDNKPILILDEATSALDSESELYVQQALEDLWSDKTVIAIAHRLSTLRHMDRILVLHDGEIVEQGTHRELLHQKSRYFDLWHHQSKGMIVDDTPKTL